MAYELKPNEELQEKEHQLAEDKEKYGDKDWSPEQVLPNYVDHSAVSSKNVKASSSKRGIIYKIIAVLLIAAFIFGIVKAVQCMVGSGGEDISQYLGKTEAEISSGLGITFEQHNERAKGVQQYSGGDVTVREGDGLMVVYIDGKQVGVCTDSRDYRFYGIGINEPKTHIEKELTYKYDMNFVVMNDLLGGHSTSLYYMNNADHTCMVITVNDDSGRVVYLSYFTDSALVTMNLSF